ncbi:MAG: hypothetical protein IKS83_03765 [Victivallales bacterium]|nr:hypothetical protein [Victivallales bacterium]
MAGETIKCPHCECKVRVSDVEKEDGFCPECGQLVMASSLQNNYDQDDLDDEDLDEFEDEYDDEEEDESDFEDDMEPDLDEDLDDDVYLDEEVKPKRQRTGMSMGGMSTSRRKVPSSAPSVSRKPSSSSSRSSRSSRKK